MVSVDVKSKVSFPFEGERLSSVFSPDGTLISTSAAPDCGGKGEEDKADRGRGGKTVSRNGQAWSSPSPQWRPGKNGGNWL